MIRPPRSRWFRALASPRLAAWLIGAGVLLSLLGVLIPQRTLLPPAMMADFRRSLPLLAALVERLGLDALFAGWPILTLVVLLSLNVLACTWRRIDTHARGPRAASPPSSAAIVPLARDGAAFLDATAEELSARGWRVVRDGERLTAVRGRHGFWGSVLLHASLLLVIAGGAITALTNFSGYLVLAEGQSVTDSAGSYLSTDRMPRVGEAFTGARVGLDSMRFRWSEDGQLVEAVAAMSGLDPDGRAVAGTSRVNYPFALAGKSYLLQDSGLTADMTVIGPGGEQELIVNLSRETASAWVDDVELRSAGGAAPVVVAVAASPVPLRAGQRLPVDKYVVRDPRLGVTLRGSSDSTPAVLAPGETARIDASTTVRFDGLRVWSRFLVRHDSARWIVYAGFWAGVLGIVWRFGVAERTLSLQLAEDGRGAGFRWAYRVRPWQGMQFASDTAMVDRLTAGLAPAAEESA